MFNRDAAPMRAAKKRSPRPASAGSRFLLAGLTFAIAGMASSQAHAQDAKTTMDKMIAVYKGAKSYAATKTTIRTADVQGKKSVITMSQQVKYQAPNKFSVTETASATGALAAQVGNGSMVTVSDGSMFWRYSSRQKQYMKQPIPAQSKGISVLQLLQLPGATPPEVKLVAPSTVSGRPALVVELMVPARPAAPGQPASPPSPVHFFIDKQNFHLLKITQTSGTMSAEVMFNPQNFNPAIPAATFHFSPPAGAKEVTPQPAPPGAGGPGAPR